jgi:hypothetical protein
MTVHALLDTLRFTEHAMHGKLRELVIFFNVSTLKNLSRAL